MRVVFMGTPDFAVPILRAAMPNNDIVAVYSQPPRPSGRGHRTTLSPVHQAAEQSGLLVHTPTSLKTEGRTGTISRAECRCRCGRSLWAHPAEGDRGRATIWLHQYSCLFTTALARRCTDPTRDSHRRYRKRCLPNENGRRFRYWASFRAPNNTNRRYYNCWRPAQTR